MYKDYISVMEFINLYSQRQPLWLKRVKSTILVDRWATAHDNFAVKHICVIGDVIQSRSVRERAVLQKQLQSSLARINQTRRTALASLWTITLGDEFQAIYREADPLFSDFISLLHDVYPVRVRFSVGMGALDTPVNRKRAIGMDGPAFHAARAGLNDLKRSHSIFRISDADASTPSWTNLALELIAHNSESWKKTRLSVLGKLMDGYDVKAIAADIHVTNAAIYKSISSGALWTVRSLLQEIAAWINARRTIE
jgi:hypothetical protein